MIYGAIDIKDEKYYTYLQSLFQAIENEQLNYNWLITCFEGYPRNEQVADKLNQEYCWLSGQELTEMIEKDNFQWVWAVISGFDKDIPISKILESPLPNMDDVRYWINPVSIQHELASIENIADDSSSTVFKSKRKDLVDKFRAYYKNSEDLDDYNKK